MLEWLSENSTWVFSGIGISIIAMAFKFLKHFSSSDSKSDISQSVNSPVSQTTNINIVPNGTVNTSNKIVSGHNLGKDNIFILFIDDEKFGVVNILKNGGWKNTKLIKDIKDLDDADLRKADIVFVDINGVGIALQFKNQGIGLASAIKSKYPHKKVVIYSGEPNGDRFDRDLRKVDDVIKKNAEPIEFMNIIDGFIRELNA